MRIATTVEEIKKFITVNKNYTPALLLPAELDAQEIVQQVTGKAQYDALQAAYTAATLTPAQTALLPYVQHAMISFAMLINSDEAQLEISNSGMQINTSAERKTAFQWQILAVKKRLKKKAYIALQNLLTFLQNSNAATDYPLWYASDERKDFLQYFINDAKTFNKNYNINGNFSFFLFLRETMADVEQKYILPVLGKPLFDQIKAQILANTLSNNNKALLQLIQRGVAWKTIYHAIPKLIGYTDEFGIVEEYISSTMDANSSNPASTDVVSLKLRTTDNEGETFISKLNDYLIANETTYPLFVLPEITTISLNNATRKVYTVL